jgi:iron complex transport system ATP-binding protein
VSAALLEARSLDIAVPGRTLVSGLGLAVRGGDFLAVLGRNGAGKTLLLLTLAGLRAPAGGELALGTAPVASLPRRLAARRVALLPQDLEPIPDLTALQAVLLGRFAHASPWTGPGDADRERAIMAMERVGVAAFAPRRMGTLSGGEQRRVAAAAAIAQDAPLVLLDEPGNHLDPHHALAVLDAFAAHARAGGAVIATLHDPTAAARHATRVLLLHGDGRWQLGTPEELLRPATLSELYRTPIFDGRIAGRRVFVAG